MITTTRLYGPNGEDYTRYSAVKAAFREGWPRKRFAGLILPWLVEIADGTVEVPEDQRPQSHALSFRTFPLGIGTCLHDWKTEEWQPDPVETVVTLSDEHTHSFWGEVVVLEGEVTDSKVAIETWDATAPMPPRRKLESQSPRLYKVTRTGSSDLVIPTNYAARVLETDDTVYTAGDFYSLPSPETGFHASSWDYTMKRHKHTLTLMVSENDPTKSNLVLGPWPSDWAEAHGYNTAKHAVPRHYMAAEATRQYAGSLAIRLEGIIAA